MDFSKKLKTLRKQKHISQEQLANDLYMSRSTIAKYESNRAIPTKENVQKLAEYFGVKEKDLYEFEEYEKVSKKEHNTRKIIDILFTWLACLVCGSSITLLFVPIFQTPNIDYDPSGALYLWKNAFSLNFVLSFMVLFLDFATLAFALLQFLTKKTHRKIIYNEIMRILSIICFAFSIIVFITFATLHS